MEECDRNYAGLRPSRSDDPGVSHSSPSLLALDTVETVDSHHSAEVRRPHVYDQVP
ncbi:MAG: hypothetical protein KME08_01310 [Aphanothece sp. CMT-3BRIN-NPC111]|nr:hypothetical protein [Aphanothece sp. CMT-3BRIN-NPC111]